MTFSISVAFSGSMSRDILFRLDSIQLRPWLLSLSTHCRSCSLLLTWPFIWTNISLLQKPWKPRQDPGNNDAQYCSQKNLAWMSKIA